MCSSVELSSGTNIDKDQLTQTLPVYLSFKSQKKIKTQSNGRYCQRDAHLLNKVTYHPLEGFQAQNFGGLFCIPIYPASDVYSSVSQVRDFLEIQGGITYLLCTDTCGRDTEGRTFFVTE